MKMMTWMLCLGLLTGIATAATAETNLLAAADGASTNLTKTVNQVMVEILSGAKVAGGEIYAFSKQELGKAYDLVKSEAPQVIQEFLRWRLAKAVVNIVVVLVVVGGCFYLAYRIKKYRGTESAEDECGRDIGMLTAGAWFLRLLAAGIGLAVVTPNIMTIVQIWVAPRVYIIEYVVALIKK